jgi:hypothetical protein
MDMGRLSLKTVFLVASISLFLFLDHLQAASNPAGSAASRCRDRILELLSLPAEGRYDTGQLVSFDRSLRRELRNVSEKKAFSLEMMSKELGIHLFPTRLRRIRERASSHDLIGFDSKGVYVQVVSQSESIPPSSFERQYLQGPNTNSVHEVRLITLPNLFALDQDKDQHLQDYVSRFGSNRSGDEVMGYLLLHEWIRAQQAMWTSWGFYLDQYSHLRHRRPDKKSPIRSRLWILGHVAAINLSGHDRLSAGAHLLNEFQAQSIVPLPGFSPKEARDLWMRVLKQLTSRTPDWEILRNSLDQFQHLLKRNQSYPAESLQQLLSPTALESALEWLWKTKTFYGSSRFKKVARHAATRGSSANQDSTPSE